MKSRLFGVLLFIETAAMLLTALVAWHYHIHDGENDYHAFLISAGITGAVGLVLYIIGRLQKTGFDGDDHDNAPPNQVVAHISQNRNHQRAGQKNDGSRIHYMSDACAFNKGANEEVTERQN